MKIPFTKMQGLGNDFAVIDATKENYPLSREKICKMADRRFGIGFDQLLLLEKPKNSEFDFNYRIFNADGGEVGQCGNGARCVARYIKEMGLSNKTQWKLQTLNGSLIVNLVGNDQVAVEIPSPSFEPQKIPFIIDEPANIYTLNLNSQPVSFRIANVGNPHAVIQVQEFNDKEIQQIGAELSKHPQFPEGVNVGFMHINTPQQINLRVFERGSGETLACGSGACAAVAIGSKAGLLENVVKVSQPGGDLIIEWQANLPHMRMIGPALFVYHGEWLDK